jgi:hypothetical protein
MSIAITQKLIILYRGSHAQYLNFAYPDIARGSQPSSPHYSNISYLAYSLLFLYYDEYKHICSTILETTQKPMADVNEAFYQRRREQVRRAQRLVQYEH